MDADLEQALKEIEIDSYIDLILDEEDLIESRQEGKLKSIDWDNRTLVLEVEDDYTEEGFSNKTFAFDKIINFRDLTYHEPLTIEESLRATSIGTYLRLWGNYGNAINDTLEQGELKSIDWDSRTLVLYVPIYKTNRTVNIDQIKRIE